MNATLWVIWVSLLTLFGSLGLAIGGRYFPSEELLAETWRDGYEEGCDDEQASCSPCERPCCAPWDDTADSLALQAQPYYEPLARGAGGTHPPVTTAPCSGDAARMAPKGDSPGPGPLDVPPGWRFAEDRPDGRVYLAPVDFVFVPANPGPPPALIFDAMVASWPQLATPLAPPPGGVAPEPSAPVLAPARNGHDPGAEDKPPGSAHAPVWISGGKEIGPEVKPPGPETCPPISEQTGPLEDTGPGPDPLFSALDDAELFAWAQFELRHVLEQAAEPFGLTPWKETTR